MVENCGGENYPTEKICFCSDCLDLRAKNMEIIIPEKLPNANINTLQECIEKINADVYAYDEVVDGPFTVRLKCKWNSDYFYALYLLQDIALVGRDVSYGGELVYVFEMNSCSIDTLFKLEKILSSQYLNAKNIVPTEIQVMRDVIKESSYPVIALTFQVRTFMSGFQKYGGASWPTIYEKSNLFPLIENAKKQLKNYESTSKRNATSKKPFVPLKWAKEYQLFHMVYVLFSDSLFQARFDWLERQSLDIFIPSLKLGIEYHGKQHYEPVERFGGLDAHSEIKKRDEKKRELCKQNGINIIEWDYRSNLTFKALMIFLKENELQNLPEYYDVLIKIKDFDVNKSKNELYCIAK